LQKISCVSFGIETMEESLAPREKNPSYDDKVLFLQIYIKNIAVGSVLYYKLIQK
jgi:hypothetical protein